MKACRTKREGWKKGKSDVTGANECADRKRIKQQHKLYWDEQSWEKKQRHNTGKRELKK